MIVVGTCSWTEKTLLKIGEFYPPGVGSADARLRYYAERFATVEVDSCYYAIPSAQTAALWAERTPANFVFHIKAYGGLTGHGVAPRTLPKHVQEMLPAGERGKDRVYLTEAPLQQALADELRQAMRPLEQGGKLGLLVFQLPPWFHYKTQSLDHLARCQELLAGFRLAIELRHGSWLAPGKAETLFAFLRERGLTYVTADEPQYGSLATVPFVPQVTSEFAYFRFHGRNKTTWLKKGVQTADRFRYLYSEDELHELRAPLGKAEGEARTVYAMFNNCYGDYATRNAQRMQQLVRG